MASLCSISAAGLLVVMLSVPGKAWCREHSKVHFISRKPTKVTDCSDCFQLQSRSREKTEIESNFNTKGAALNEDYLEKGERKKKCCTVKP